MESILCVFDMSPLCFLFFLTFWNKRISFRLPKLDISPRSPYNTSLSSTLFKWSKLIPQKVRQIYNGYYLMIYSVRAEHYFVKFLPKIYSLNLIIIYYIYTYNLDTTIWVLNVPSAIGDCCSQVLFRIELGVTKYNRSVHLYVCCSIFSFVFWKL